MLELHNTEQGHENGYDNKQHFIAAFKEIVVLIFIFPVGKCNSNYKTNKKEDRKNDLAS
jgi:hypothetical protein